MKSLLLFSILLLTQELNAQNLILNSSFEQCTPSAAPGGYSENPTINNWNRVGYIDVHSNAIASLLDGKLMGGFDLQHIDLNGTFGSIEQIVPNLEVGKTYYLSYYTAISVHIVEPQWIQRAAFRLTDTKSNHILAADSWTLGFNDRAVWKKHTYQFKAESNSVSIKFFSITGSSTSQHGVLIDSVSLYTPEAKPAVKSTKLSYSICASDTVVINNTKYFNSGSYTDTLKTYLGEDSVLLIDIRLKSGNGCVKQPYYIPDAFSPNGDQINDLFKVYGVDVSAVNMRIYNRWGEMVFDNKNSGRGWDGRYKEEICEQGVYLYLIEIKSNSGVVYPVNGTLTLLR